MMGEGVNVRDDFVFRDEFVSCIGDGGCKGINGIIKLKWGLNDKT